MCLCHGTTSATTANLRVSRAAYAEEEFVPGQARRAKVGRKDVLADFGEAEDAGADFVCYGFQKRVSMYGHLYISHTSMYSREYSDG